MQTLLQDLRFSVRMLRTKIGFTLAAILSLALGIGACTAIFSIVDGVLLRALDYPQPERLLRLNEINESGNSIRLADPNFMDIQTTVHSLSAVAEFSKYSTAVLGGKEPVRVPITIATGEFFKILNVAPSAGRTFTTEGLPKDGHNVAVVSYGFWQKMLNGEGDLAQHKLRIDNESYNVIGVMPPKFNYPSDSEVWLPRDNKPLNTSRTAHNWHAITRLRDGVTLEQARAELTALARQLKQTHSKATDAVDFVIVPLQEMMVKDVRRTLLIGVAAVLLLLLIACANVANLLLAQATTRQKELAVRLALGATRWRLLQQFIVECLLLALVASGIGILFSFWGVDLLVGLNRAALPRVNEIGVNWRALSFTIALSVLVAAGLGALIAYRAGADVNLQTGLKESARGASASRKTGALRNSLVVAQIGLALMLLVSAGLLIRSFTHLLEVDPGFRTDSAITMNVSLPWPEVEGKEQRRAAFQKIALFHAQLIDRLRQLPGVVSVGGIDALPMTGNGSDGQLVLDNNPQKKGYANYRAATQDYFTAMGMELKRGRFFADTDKPGNVQVAVINEAAARDIWKSEDPLGKQIGWSNMDGDEQPIQIVGVVNDVREDGLDTKVNPIIYINAMQRPWRIPEFTFVVRAQEVPVETLIPAARRTVQSMNSDVPVEFRTLEKVFSSTLDQRRFSLVIFAVFASVALLLAVTGIYAMMSYTVTQRVNEIGIRMALGASVADVLKLIMRSGAKLILPGILLGIAGAFAVTRLLTSLLYEVSATDPLTFAGVALLLITVALFACFLPARRATKVDPMIALRCE